MKKVLIIGFFWPYRGGSRRIIGLAKYLPEFGWEPIILTAPLDRRPDPQFRVLETPPFLTATSSFKQRLGFSPIGGFQEQIGIPVSIRESKRSFTSRLISLIKGIITYPDEYRNWKPCALRIAEEFLKKEKVDRIISIWPVTAHFIAKELKHKYKIPWIADFPDLWSQNCDYNYGPIRKLMDKRLELMTVYFANALVTTSKVWAEDLRKLHKHKAIYSITHGFDPDEANVSAEKLSPKFTLTYTGIFYSGKRDPVKLFIALKELISKEIINPKDVEIKLIGPKEDWIKKEIETHALTGIANLYGIISRESSIKKQRKTQILLLLNWEDKKEKGVLTGKIFEYLAAKRPILVTGGYKGDVVEKLIKETKAGVYCPKIEDIKDALVKFYSEYKKNGKVAYFGNWVEIKKYSQVKMARKFANLLNRVYEIKN